MSPLGGIEGRMNMDIKRKIRIVFLSAAAALAFVGCGSKESADGLQSGEESVAQVRGQEESNAADSQGSAGDSAVSGVVKEPSQSDLPVNIPAGQITEQSFEVALDGWGDVTFASFEPEQYSVVTDISAWEVERFAESVRQDILSGDFEALSQKINFPITIDRNVYSGKEAFLSADFVKNPNKAFLETIEQSATANLFCNWQGMMLGNGEVWFAEVSGAGSNTSQGLRVIAINGISEEQQSSQAAMVDSWQQEAALIERTDYYIASAYYHDIVGYWENVRGVKDIANQTDFLFATDSCYYTAEDFKEEPSLVIHLAKNEIYARHGYIFEDPDLYNYFMGCIWYEPTTAPRDFDVSVLNEYERENVVVLAELDNF